MLARTVEGDGIPPSEIGRSLDLSTSTMTGLADRLEDDGLIRRHPHPTDRRVLLLRATRKGHSVASRRSAPSWGS